MIMFSKEFRNRHNHSSGAFDSSANLLRHRGRSANNSELSIAPAPLFKERRTVLIATMEYDIEDWAIKVKIGGLGVMAQLMGKNRKSPLYHLIFSFSTSNQANSLYSRPSRFNLGRPHRRRNRLPQRHARRSHGHHHHGQALSDRSAISCPQQHHLRDPRCAYLPCPVESGTVS